MDTAAADTTAASPVTPLTAVPAAPTKTKAYSSRFVEVVIKRMVKLGVNQRTIADRCKISDGYVSLILSGRRLPTPDIAQKMAHGLLLNTEQTKDLLAAAAEARGYINAPAATPHMPFTAPVA